MAEEFSRRQVELILRRTVELERDDDSDAVTSVDLERVAAELGLSQAALAQAMAESRAGLLAVAGPPGLLDRAFGPGFVEAIRHVPGEVASVTASVERFLERQGFERKRHRGEVTLWEPARDLWTRLRRTFRAGAYRLPREIEIEVRVSEVPGGAHPVLVRLRADARQLRNARVGAAAASLVAGAGVAVVGAVLLPMPVELALWAGGAATGAAGTLGGRASYRTARERLETALQRFLDFLEHEPAPSAARPKDKDPISRLVDFLASDWWR